jgi:uncharacterized alkaline shock family protein YloU
MTDKESPDDQPSLGEIKINNSVVATIVRLAALEVDGVCGVGAGFVDGIADLFSKKESDRGVRVSTDDNGNYVIEIRIVVSFGTEIAQSAYNVQTAVRKRLVAMTGNNVANVDVIVEGVKTFSPKSADSDQSEDAWPHSDHMD